MISTGLYDRIIDELLHQELEKLKYNIKKEGLSIEDSHTYLSHHIKKIIEEALNKINIKKEEKLIYQINLCNKLIDLIKSSPEIDSSNISEILPQAEKLLDINDSSIEQHKRPDTPLSLGAIITGSRIDPSLSSQIKKEIDTCDNIDILCSFIKWSGIIMLLEDLRSFVSNPNHKLRILTTTYMGATDAKAIEKLASLPNTEIKISYDTRRTRLHAKAYMFYRKTGFSSAYIGSSNLSSAALTDGMEWNVKISQYEQPYQLEKISANFETLWNDSEFEEYDSSKFEKLQSSLNSEKTYNTENENIMSFFDINPYSYQQEILDKIEAEREIQNKSKHLIVSATGTGKTMIAAFDYRNFSKKETYKPKLLFIAHREEILKQALGTFRLVLKDYNFGDLMVGEHTPKQEEALFVSIQTYNSKKLYETFDPNHFDYVIIDEFHHSAAPSYRNLINTIKPKVLLGLTATPERMDGFDVTDLFDNHTTSEIRLPDAISQKLLCPFQYFCITDDTVDFAKITWSRGGYNREELSNILSANDVRAKLIINKCKEILLNIHKAKGIGFCTSQRHAEFMADKFNSMGIKSIYLTSESDKEIRNKAKSQIETGEINFIFTVDLFNEGVDIPSIDTVLFLRPTESLTVFIQQLGRGLRLYDNKDNLTVIDFVGHAHKNFSYETKFSALLNNTEYSIENEVELNFPHLPVGCSIYMERIAKDHILENIKASINNRPQIIKRISTFEADTGKKLSLQNFLDYYRLKTSDIFIKDYSWSKLLASANIINDYQDEDSDDLITGIRRIQHIDDPILLSKFKDWLNNGLPKSLSDLDKKRALMIHTSLWSNRRKFKDIYESFETLSRNKYCVKDLIDLLSYKQKQIGYISEVVKLPYECPLSIHSSYTRDEILAALGKLNINEQSNLREGVRYFEDLKTDTFFVTYNKAAKHYSPTTRYEDYIINSSLIHWQSQSTTSVESKTGQRYLNHKSTGNIILIFARENKSNNGLAEPYRFLGPAEYVQHSGSKPISIVWRLINKMPEAIVREGMVA